MYKYLRPMFFAFQPETIHKLVVFLLKFSSFIPGCSWFIRLFCQLNKPQLNRNLFGLQFTNPIGLAAGFDKNAEVYNQLSDLGFGFVEIGSVTPLPQQGNPKPRCFRLPQDESIINRMGFNNMGLEQAVKHLSKKRRPNLIIGGNIGKNTSTPNHKAAEDYLYCFKGLYDYVDYFVVNVSCPNISNLHKLQDKDALDSILRILTEERKFQDTYKPVLLKISPDLNTDQIDDMIDLIRETGLDGIVACNTTTSRENLNTPPDEISAIANGGLSGKALTNRALQVVNYIHKQTKGQIPIIGVGGIMCEADALRMLEAGACLVQIYSGFIYQGPGLIKRILKKIPTYISE